jgi:hypothetical protein
VAVTIISSASAALADTHVKANAVLAALDIHLRFMIHSPCTPAWPSFYGSSGQEREQTLATAHTPIAHRDAGSGRFSTASF